MRFMCATIHHNRKFIIDGIINRKQSFLFGQYIYMYKCKENVCVCVLLFIAEAEN